jgi:hypothetical protein
MNSTVAVRQEMHSCIDRMSISRLWALQPLLSELAFDDTIIIETDLTEEEHAIIAESEKRYLEHPEDFTDLDDII